jgi:hypothetical protein
MKRIYHRYELWEDVAAGMWRKVTMAERKKYLQQAIDFTGDSELYGSWMLKVIIEWPLSCEHNMTAVDSNRKAFVGHAAVCLALGIPEDITREAWKFLSIEQQDKANDKAGEAIAEWERKHEMSDKTVSGTVEAQRVFGWYTR